MNSSAGETTVTIPTDAHDLKFTGALGSYPMATIVEITMQGSSIAGYKYSSAGQGDFWADIGLAGVVVGSSCHGGVVVHFSASASYRYGLPYDEGCPKVGTGNAKLSWSTIRKVSGNGSVLRSDLISDSCGGPCRKYEGGEQTVSVRRMPAELRLSPSQALIEPGQSVTFTASADPDSISKIKTPFSGITWLWQADGGIATEVCSGRTTCTPPAGASGTLTVSAMVNALMKTRAARVEVKTDQLNLSANRSTVKPGEEVTFTASTQNGTPFTVQEWTWISTAGGPVQLTPSGYGCGQQKSCTIRVYEDGYMTVSGIVEGTTIPQKASASVDVIPCPPLGAGSSSPLEIDAIRKILLEEWALSRNGQYSERGGEIWYDPTSGAYYVRVIPNLLYPNSCTYMKDLANAPPVPPGFTHRLPVIWHTHPEALGKPVTSNCKDKDGNIKKGSTGGGPSWPDWVGAATDGPGGSEGILIDSNLDIWQFNVPIDPYYDGYESENAVRWKKDGQSICYGDKDQPLKTS